MNSEKLYSIPNYITFLLLLGIIIVPISYFLFGNLTLYLIYLVGWLILTYLVMLNRSKWMYKFHVSKITFSLAILSAYSLLSFIIYQHYEDNYIKPVFFLFVLLFFSHVEDAKFKFSLKRNVCLGIFIFHLLSSYLVYLLEVGGLLEREFVYRFMGFHLSPTTFAMYTTAFFIIASFCTSSVLGKLILYLATLFLLLESGTRINIFFFLGVFPLLFTGKRILRKKLFWFGSFLSILLLYPTFTLVEVLVNGFVGRNEDTGFDSGSSAERLAILAEQLLIIKNSSIVQHVFGYGPEACLDLFSYLNDRPEVGVRVTDGKPGWTHFDFTRIYIEFGFFFTFSFFKYLFSNFTKSKLTGLLLLNYFISFYHNGYNDPLNFILLLSGRYVNFVD